MTSPLQHRSSHPPPTSSAEEPLPSTWDATPRVGHSNSMRYLEVSGTRVRYKGPGSDDRDAAAVKTDHPVPSSAPFYYFEVEIRNKGRDGFIGIGFSVQDVKLDRLPGWEPRSYGYHGDDGHIFAGRGAGKPYGPVFGTGDWIGVFFNRIEGSISFTKRGYDLGVAFEGVKEERLYPTVGFRTPDEEIVANFGTNINANPFKGDYEGLKRDASLKLYSTILNTPLPKPSTSHDVIGELVFGYLMHHGHWESATAVAKDVLGGGAEVPATARQEAQALRGITDALADGDVDAAVKIAEKLAPGVLEANPRVQFALECQKFCELIATKQDEQAMSFGRDVLMPKVIDAVDRELLDQALTLFAYADISQAPAGYLVQGPYRAQLAASVQRAVRTHLGRREVSALEDVYRQAVAAHGELKRLGAPVAEVAHLGDVMLHRAYDGGTESSKLWGHASQMSL